MTRIPSKIEIQWLSVQYAVSRVLLEATNLDDAAESLLQAIGEGMQQEVSGTSHTIGAFWIIDLHATVLRCLTTWHASTISAPEFDASLAR